MQLKRLRTSELMLIHPFSSVEIIPPAVVLIKDVIPILLILRGVVERTWICVRHEVVSLKKRRTLRRVVSAAASEESDADVATETSAE